MPKKVALQTDPTSDGSVVVVPSTQPTLNGLPIATQGSKLLYRGSPIDQPLEFVSGVLINDKPLTFVGAKTSAGATILTANQTTATIEAADGGSSEESTEPKEESEKVKLKSKYPFLELQKISEQIAKSTFYFMMVTFFEEDIPIIAYEELYNLLRKKDESLMPEIQVLKCGLSGAKQAAFNKSTKKIEVRESTVIKAVEGEDEEKVKARSELLQALLEEYGHFLDDLLRNKFSGVHGDAIKDEGAVFSYYFTNYQITDKEINYAVAEIDGVETEFIIKLDEITQEYENIKSRIEADYQSKEEEYFKAGKGDVKMKEYGHFDFVSVLKDKGIINEYALSWFYLGNFMRDMSQVITPGFNELTPEQIAEVDGADPEIRGLLKYSFFDVFKFTRTTWTKIVEVMAAHHTISELRGDDVDALEDKGGAMLDKILNPANVTETLSTGKKVQDFMKEKAVDMGIKAAQYTLDYYNFIKHFDHISEKTLGVYRPEEHIDNPIYAAVYDDSTSPRSLYYCPPRKKDQQQTNPSIGEVYGMKRHIRNEEGGVEKGTDAIDGAVGLGDYAGGTLPTAIATMKDYYRKGVTIFKDKSKPDKQRLLGLTHIGAAMHILEDFFAHTNFCEILLIKHGVSVYPWVNVGDPELTNYNKTKKYFRVKNGKSTPSDNKRDKGDLPEATYFGVKDLYDSLSKTGECKLLPSFWVEGIYFLYKPKGKRDATSKLYLAGKRSLPSGMLKMVNVGVNKPDPLNLQCIDSRKNELYSYDYLECSLVDDSTLVYRDDGGNDKKYYAEQIPIVSGYFSMSDTIHSLVGLMDKLFEDSKIDIPSVFSTNNMKFEYSKAIQLMDMLILDILVDMKLSQYEESKNLTQTGKKGDSDLIEIYRGLILMREVIIGVSEQCIKKAGPAGLVIYLVNRLINTGYAVVMNMVKSYVHDILHTMNDVIKTWQSMQITYSIGTNPSHTQLAKDETHHPLHSLAGELARYCIEQMGGVFGDLILENSKNSPDVIANTLIKTSVDFMQHPSQCTWADEIAKKWIADNPDRIETLHTEEYNFRKAEKLGRDINEVLAEMQGMMNKLKSAANDAIDKIKQKWKDLQGYYQEFLRSIQNIQNKVGDKIDEYMKEMDGYYEQLKHNMERFYDKYFAGDFNAPELQLYEGGFNRNSVQMQLKIEKILKSMDSGTKEYSPDIQGQLMAFHRGEVARQKEELRNPPLFQEKLYTYCYQDTKDEKYREYGQKMHEYIAFQERRLRTEEEYLAKTPDYYIARLGKTRTISFLHDDSDTGLSMDKSLYKTPKRKGWFG